MKSSVERLRASPPRIQVAVLVGLVLAVLIVVLLLNRLGDEDGAARGDAVPGGPTGDSSGGSADPEDAEPRPTLDADGTPRPTPEPGQTAPSPVETPEDLPKPVRAALGAPADLGNGVRVRVSDIAGVEGVGRGPGESSGPALRVSVSVSNESDEALGMLSSVVGLSYGPRGTPADDLAGPGAQGFPELIRPGASAEGRFVFRVPPSERSEIVVEFRYSTEAPEVVFRGAA